MVRGHVAANVFLICPVLQKQFCCWVKMLSTQTTCMKFSWFKFVRHEVGMMLLHHSQAKYPGEGLAFLEKLSPTLLTR